jgi:hypothetical protein
MLSFQSPFHTMCATHTAVLSHLDNSVDIVYFDFLQLDQCPDVIIMASGRFKYKGVSDGQARYKEEEKEMSGI